MSFPPPFLLLHKTHIRCAPPLSMLISLPIFRRPLFSRGSPIVPLSGSLRLRCSFSDPSYSTASLTFEFRYVFFLLPLPGAPWCFLYAYFRFNFPWDKFCAISGLSFLTVLFGQSPLDFSVIGSGSTSPVLQSFFSMSPPILPGSHFPLAFLTFSPTSHRFEPPSVPPISFPPCQQIDLLLFFLWTRPGTHIPTDRPPAIFDLNTARFFFPALNVDVFFCLPMLRGQGFPSPFGPMDTCSD